MFRTRSQAFLPILLAALVALGLPAACHGQSPGAVHKPAVGDGLIPSPEKGWPQWRGPRRDGVSEEKGLLSSWPTEGPPLLWKTAAIGQGWSSPIVAGDRVYVTGDVDGDLVIFALNREGKVVWRTTNGKAWNGPYPGARASCAYSGGRLYHLNAHGRVACLDAATGKELWAVDVLERFQGRQITWALSECLLVDEQRVIVTPAGQKALMAALDKTDGRTRWTTETMSGERAGYASPILFRHAGRRVLTNCTSAHGVGVDADTGKLLWTVPLRNQHEVNVASPIYGAGRVFFVTAYSGGACYELGVKGGDMHAEKVWDTKLDTVTGSGVLVDGQLYAGGYGKSKWWMAIDWQTGRLEHELKDLVTGSAVYADGRLYCLADNGEAALLKPSPQGFESAGRFRLPRDISRDAWAHPVVCDGRLYLRYHDTLWCHDVRGAASTRRYPD